MGEYVFWKEDSRIWNGVDLRVRRNFDSSPPEKASRDGVATRRRRTPQPRNRDWPAGCARRFCYTPNNGKWLAAPMKKMMKKVR